MTFKEKTNLKIHEITLAALGLLLADLQRRLIDDGEAAGELYLHTTNLLNQLCDVGKVISEALDES